MKVLSRIKDFFSRFHTVLITTKDEDYWKIDILPNIGLASFHFSSSTYHLNISWLFWEFSVTYGGKSLQCLIDEECLLEKAGYIEYLDHVGPTLPDVEQLYKENEKKWEALKRTPYQWGKEEGSNG